MRSLTVVILWILVSALSIYVVIRIRQTRQLLLADAFAALGVVLALLFGLVSLPDQVGIDNAVRLEYKIGEGHPAVLQKFSPSKSRGDYIGIDDPNIVLPTELSVAIDVISQVDDEQVKLAPYLAIEMIQVEPLTDTVDVVTEWGAGALYIDTFGAVLSPRQENLFGAPYVPDPGNVDIDYFVLDSGEREVFLLDLHTAEPGYRYDFRVGVIYDYKGEQSIKWVDEILTVLSPFSIREWRDNIDKPGLLPIGDTASPATFNSDDLVDMIMEDRRKVRQDLYFDFP